jgi:hypothetical protein
MWGIICLGLEYAIAPALPLPLTKNSISPGITVHDHSYQNSPTRHRINPGRLLPISHKCLRHNAHPNQTKNVPKDPNGKGAVPNKVRTRQIEIVKND